MELDHLLASAGLIPDFPASEIGGRLLGDGGLSANTPVGAVLADAPRDLVCIASDCFPRVAPRPGNWLEASERQSDLLFANQTKKAIEAASHSYALRRQLSGLLAALPASLRAKKELRPFAAFRDTGNLDVLRIEYRPTPDEIGMKWFDFSASAFERRWRAGKASMETALKTLSRLPKAKGLRVTGV